MIEPKTTKTYDLHLCFEPQYDEQPRLYVRELFLDRDGDWNTDDSDSFSYFYTQEDIEWTVGKFNLDEIYDLYVDEWFTTEDRHLMENNLPPKVIQWVESLPAYEYYNQQELEEATA
jgi:hypothetical protein